MDKNKKKIYLNDIMRGKFIFKSGNVFHCSENWAWKTDKFRDYDIWMVLSGMGTLVSEDKHYEIGRGDCFIFYPGCSHQARHRPESPLNVVAVHFDFSSSGGSCGNDGRHEKYPAGENNFEAGTASPEAEKSESPFNYHRKLRNPEFTAEMLKRSIDFQRAGNREKADFWLEAALVSVLEYDAEKHQEKENIHAGKIDRLCREIASHPEVRYDIRRMAAGCGVCRDHFCRIFRELKGKGPQEYIIDCRMERAKELLTESSLSIKEIALELGYGSEYFFSRQFKLKAGTSPRGFRK